MRSIITSHEHMPMMRQGSVLPRGPTHEYCAHGRTLTNWDPMPLAAYVFFICINMK